MNSDIGIRASHPDSTSVLARKARPPDLLLRYGPEDDHVADVHLPPTYRTAADPAPRVAPLVLFLHGGFWRAKYGREHTAPLAEALAAAGFLVCAPEYRRTGQRGGGWPGTFDDVAAAADRLPGLVATAIGAAAELPVVLAGHSAGGHLALWAASRHQLPAGTPWQLPPRHSVRAAVALAAVSDLAACYRASSPIATWQPTRHDCCRPPRRSGCCMASQTTWCRLA